MKLIVYLVSLVVVVVSAQQPFVPRPGLFNNPYAAPTPFAPAAPYAGPFVPILDYSNEINVDGSYRYNFVTADGKQAEESGYLKDVSVDKDGQPIGIQVVQGSYSYTSPDGTPVQVTYIADENGFQPTSVRIPSDGRVNGNPINPRPSIYPTPFRTPYNVNPFLGRYNTPFVNNNNYNKPAIKNV